VDWPSRLGAELPFIETQLQATGARRVLDVACGTGRHAVALAGKGYAVTGTDLSPQMIERARVLAASEDTGARFEVAGFGELHRLAGTAFDGLLCLGNSLTHVLTADGVRFALEDFAACLNPGGLLLIQNRNFDAVMSDHERWMDPQAYQEGNAEWLFFRFYDFEPDGLLTFNLVTLFRQKGGKWQQRPGATRLRPLLKQEMEQSLAESGFADIRFWGDMQGATFDADRSPNLVVTARRELSQSGGRT
jgi:glycine/sarcosine N-methyltransferase